MHLAACAARSLGENLALVGDHERVLLAAHDLDHIHARQRHHVRGRRDLRHWRYTGAVHEVRTGWCTRAMRATIVRNQSDRSVRGRCGRFRGRVVVGAVV